MAEQPMKTREQINEKIEELFNRADKMTPSEVLFSASGDEIHHKVTALLWVLGCTDIRGV